MVSRIAVCSGVSPASPPPFGMSQTKVPVAWHSSSSRCRLRTRMPQLSRFTRRFCPRGAEPQSADGDDHRYRRPRQDLRFGLRRAARRRPADPPRRDLRAARAERRGQDDADQHRVRHRHREPRHGARRWPRRRARLARRAALDRARAAGAEHRRVRDGVERGALQPRTVRQAARPGAPGGAAAAAVAVGQEGHADHGAVGRHEAARADRQGAEPRAAHPVPRRADRGRRRRTAPRHVAHGARPAGHRGDGHPDHALHRGGRGDGRPRGRDRQGPHRPRRGQGAADGAARPAAADAAARAAARRAAAGPAGLRRRAVGGRRATRLPLRRPRRARADRRTAAPAGGARHRLQGPADGADLARGHLRQPGAQVMNLHAIRAIYRFEMARTWRTLLQSIASPVISTSLYFVVFGSAIGSRMAQIDGVDYAAFIVPGLIMLSILTESLSNASFGIYMPRFSGTIYEVLSAPISALEIVIGYVGAAASKSIVLGLLMLATARLFVDFGIAHPLWMIGFLVLTSVTFSLFGFVIGVWADGFEKLQIVPAMIVTPLAFLGGSFYSIHMLPPLWQQVTLFNPVVYLVSGFRWSFYGVADVSVPLSLGMTAVFMLVCLGVITWIFRTGYKLKA